MFQAQALQVSGPEAQLVVVPSGWDQKVLTCRVPVAFRGLVNRPVTS
jgi:hypothetical protein